MKVIVCELIRLPEFTLTGNCERVGANSHVGNQRVPSLISSVVVLNFWDANNCGSSEPLRSVIGPCCDRCCSSRPAGILRRCGDCYLIYRHNEHLLDPRSGHRTPPPYKPYCNNNAACWRPPARAVKRRRARVKARQ